MFDWIKKLFEKKEDNPPKGMIYVGCYPKDLKEILYYHGK